jgi:hypothetical protein
MKQKDGNKSNKRISDWNLHILQSLFDGPLTLVFFRPGPESLESSEGSSSSFLAENEEVPPRVPLRRRTLRPPAIVIGKC